MNRWAYGILGLALIVLLFFFVPVATFLWSGFREATGPAQVGEGLSLSNYETIATDRYYLDLVTQTVWLSALSAFFATLVAYPIAYVVARSRPLISRVVFLTTIATLFTSFIIGALGLQIVLSEAGPISFVTERLGLGSFRVIGSRPAVVIGMVHSTAPLAVIALIPACERINDSYLTAAYGLGASSLRVARTIIWPLTRGAVISVSLLMFAVATGLFVTPLLLGGGRVGMMAIEIRQQILSLLDYPLGGALATVLVAIVTLITIVALLSARRTTVRGASL